MRAFLLGLISLSLMGCGSQPSNDDDSPLVIEDNTPESSSLSFTGIDSYSNVTGISLSLNWTHVAGAQVYLVYDVTSGTPTLVANTSAPNVTVQVTDLNPMTSYTFRVRLLDSEGLQDDNTNDVSITTGTAECYRQTVLALSPVAFYRMNESSGTTVSDDTTNALDGTLGGGYTLGAGTAIQSEAGTAIEFDGSTGNVDLGNPTELQMTGDQTIEMWVYPNAFSGRQNPYAKAYGGEGTITIETNRTINYYYGTNGGNGSPYQGFNSSGTITQNAWNHIVMVRDLTNMTLRWYINGVETNSAAASYAAAAAGGNSVTLAQGYVNNFNGRMDGVALYDKALSAAEVLANYNAAITGCP